jgi:hypothetical protein
VTYFGVKFGLIEAAEIALAAGDVDALRDVLQRLDELRPGELTPVLEASRARMRARLAVLEGGAAEDGFEHAEALFRKLGMPFYLAATQLEHAEWLAGGGDAEEAEPLLAEATEVFQRLMAAPWLERAQPSPSTAVGA